jgi:hypothetical protein
MRGGRFEQNVSGSKAAMAGRRSAADCREYRPDRPENWDPNGDPIRYQDRSQRVTRHPTGLAGPDVTKRQAQRGISAFGGPKKWWTGGELNLNPARKPMIAFILRRVRTSSASTSVLVNETYLNGSLFHAHEGHLPGSECLPSQWFITGPRRIQV